MTSAKKPLAALLALFLAIALSACEVLEIPLIDPPQLRLDIPPPPPRLTQVTVTNGAGKQIMSGAPEGKSRTMSADPALEDLDGTLRISYMWSNGRSRTDVVTHTAHRPVSIEYSQVVGAFIEVPQVTGPSRSDYAGGD